MKNNPTKVRSIHHVSIPEEEALRRMVKKIDAAIERTYMSNPGYDGRLSVEVSTVCDPPLSRAQQFTIAMLLVHVYSEAGFDVDPDYDNDRVFVSWVGWNLNLGETE